MSEFFERGTGTDVGLWRRLSRAVSRGGLRNLKLNPSRKYLHDYVREVAASLPERALVLDAGAGTGLYRPLFSGACYQSTDFCRIEKDYGEITYVCDLARIPVKRNSYDLVLLTQVLEHVPEPGRVLREIHRVLKPGGHLWLSAPFFFDEHEIPFDFYRYTRYGIEYLLHSAGFAIETLEWLEGYYGTWAYQLKTAAGALPNRPVDYGGGPIGFLAAAFVLLLKPFLVLLAVAFSVLDRRKKHVSSGHCKNYVVRAVKERGQDGGGHGQRPRAPQVQQREASAH